MVIDLIWGIAAAQVKLCDLYLSERARTGPAIHIIRRGPFRCIACRSYNIIQTFLLTLKDTPFALKTWKPLEHI